MLKIKNLNLKFGDKIIFKDFSIDFEDQKINCIMGPSSCGKTTLLRFIAKLQKVDSGEMITNQKGISFVFQEDTLIEEITVFKNLDLVIKKFIQNEKEREKKIIHYLKIAKMTDTKNMYPNQLSGSARQRVSLLRAFLFPSDTMLLDEPFIGLDYNLKHKLIQFFLKLYKKTKKTVLIVNHNIDDCYMFAHRVYLFNKTQQNTTKYINIQLPLNKRKLYDAPFLEFKKEMISKIKKW